MEVVTKLSYDKKSGDLNIAITTTKVLGIKMHVEVCDCRMKNALK